MLATGRIYDNITFIELGSILRLDAQRAEKVKKLLSNFVHFWSLFLPFNFQLMKHAEFIILP
jgi:hypothetical protein